LYRIQPQNSRDVRDLMHDSDEECEEVTDFDRICEDVQVGENVAVPTDVGNEPFWILLCDKAAHVVQESFVDGWGNSYVIGDVVIRSACKKEVGLTSYDLTSLMHICLLT
jgi:hypothetical protein